MNQENNYHISFFRPTTQRAKTNRNTVLWLISIWAVAVFGFHFLLRAIEKPTPEPELISFNEVWKDVKAENASVEEIRIFAKTTLHVAGKVFITTEERAALDNGISWAIMQLADSMQKLSLKDALQEFETIAEKNLVVTNEDYVASKKKLGAIVQQILNLNPSSVLATILPLEIKSSGLSVLSVENMTIIEACMPKYMIHNRSVLTDTKFLGFPFHYFYTAVFLLILFIALCYAYCVRVDNYNKKVGIAE